MPIDTVQCCVPKILLCKLSIVATRSHIYCKVFLEGLNWARFVAQDLINRFGDEGGIRKPSDAAHKKHQLASSEQARSGQYVMKRVILPTKAL